MFHDDWVATYIWRTSHVCQSMLSTSNTLDDRRYVYRRIADFNVALQQECAVYVNCRFDGDALFDYYITSDQVSKLDYFHPNRNGQNALAATTWAASWWAPG